VKTVQADPSWVLGFTLAKAVTGEKTVPQVKAHLRDVFLPYGPVDEIQVASKDDAKEIVVLFSRLLEKGQALQAAVVKDGKGSIKVYDSDVEVKASNARVSHGGRSTGTAHKKSDKPPKMPRGGGRGGKGGKEFDDRDPKKEEPKKDDKKGAPAAAGKAAAGKDDKAKDGAKKDDKAKDGAKKDDKKADAKKDDKKADDKKDAKKK
jgi:hypothetical protein